MDKINSLTPEQIAQFPRYVDEWTKHGLSTQPADRPRAEAAIRKMYEIAGLKAPAIVWCGSPMSQGITRDIVQKHSKKIGASVGASVGDSVWASVRASVRDSVGASVWASVWASVVDSVVDSVGASVWASVWASVGASVVDSVRASVRDSVGASVGASAGASVGDSVWDSVYGSHDASWLAFYRYFNEQCGLTKETEKLDGLWELCQSAGWALPHENICWVSERHTQIHQEKTAQGRFQLHCENGPSVAYPDGWMLWYIHGVRVTEQIVMKPETITKSQIDSESNTEVKRIMLQRYGHEKYLRESDAILVDECTADHPMLGLRTAKLYKMAGDVVVIDALNSTPEPDGTTKRYVLSVDGDRYDGMAGKNCQAAMASTWRVKGQLTELLFKRYDEYCPAFES